MFRRLGVFSVVLVAGWASLAFSQGTTGGSVGLTESGFACFGLQCPDDPYYDSAMPTMPNGMSTWGTYGDWRGLTAGFHMPPEHTVEQCNYHCFDHARAAQTDCLSVGGTDGQCNSVFQSTLNSCATQCIDNDH
ncbi:hypothetical protein D1227_05245 [Henriciella mobilis]|uniref:hypothetical protein n=1 Tax=Henriciella mobilis TaxID=2305467 RepID=UPI000E668837|nr:hypothetical protein [Henriciella mobilis]RIJ16176.1 hypothetical protein D1231_10355 [Henriciella mobilis]RIJ22914.1 hypothetical protein D1227_05245 [Henriciella mobilis]